MCLMCQDESVYRAYMAYLDEVEKRGQEPDMDQALEAAMQAAMVALGMPSEPDENAPLPPNASPFSCDPVDE